MQPQKETHRQHTSTFWILHHLRMSCKYQLKSNPLHLPNPSCARCGCQSYWLPQQGKNWCRMNDAGHLPCVSRIAYVYVYDCIWAMARTYDFPNTSQYSSILSMSYGQNPWVSLHWSILCIYFVYMSQGQKLFYMILYVCVFKSECSARHMNKGQHLWWKCLGWS